MTSKSSSAPFARWETASDTALVAKVVPIRIVPGQRVDILDQTLLPFEERYVPIRDLDASCEAIRSSSHLRLDAE